MITICDCNIKNYLFAKKIFSNGVAHVFAYCDICKTERGISKKGFNIDELPDYNLTIGVYIKINKDRKEAGNHPVSLVYHQDYINSEEWQVIRHEVLDRDNRTCQICGDVATDVHHLNYAHLGKEYLFELVSLCRHCHYNEYHKGKHTHQ